MASRFSDSRSSSRSRSRSPPTPAEPAVALERHETLELIRFLDVIYNVLEEQLRGGRPEHDYFLMMAVRDVIFGYLRSPPRAGTNLRDHYIFQERVITLETLDQLGHPRQ